MFSYCVLVSDKVPPPLPPSTIVEWNPALRPGQLGNEVTSLLRPFFWSHGKTAIHFLVKKNLRQYGHPTANFFLAQIVF